MLADIIDRVCDEVITIDLNRQISKLLGLLFWALLTKLKILCHVMLSGSCEICEPI